MYKLVKTPGELTPFLNEYKDLFTKPSHKSFSHMVSAISVCTKSRTVNNLHDTMSNTYEDKKSRSTYDWFFNQASWNEDEVSQRKADMFFKALDLEEKYRILLIIDDTYKEKKGNCTDGVGKFFDHSKGYVWGNNFVTSVLQCKGFFIPHIAKMYIKEEDVSTYGINFRTKPQIAFEDIIKPLKIPEGTELMIVFDSWWFSSSLIKNARELKYHITCQLKSDKKIILEDNSSLQVQLYAKEFNNGDYSKIKIKVRGKNKTYSIIDRVVELDKIGKVRLIISRKSQKEEPKYYICTNLDLSPEEILTIYEDRWNIETCHRESNQKLGFKDYQLRDKKAIERFIQLTFVTWTLILLMELENEPDQEVVKNTTIGESVDKIRTSGFIDLVKEVMDYFNLPYPEGGLLCKMREIGMKT